MVKKTFKNFLVILSASILVSMACNFSTLPGAATATAAPSSTAISSATHPPAVKTRTTPPATPTFTLVPPSPAPTTGKGNTYTILQTITLSNEGSSTADITLKVALIQDIDHYQQVVSMEISPSDYKTETDEYGNQYAAIKLNDLQGNASVTVEIQYKVKVLAIYTDLGKCAGVIPDDLASSDWVKAEKFVESSDPAIVDLGNELSNGKSTLCDRARAFYDYVIDNINYGGYNPGDKGALATLNDKSGDCTDFTDLYNALSRAAGIPTRHIEGVVCCGDDPGQVKHNWAESYLPGSGWVPVDATWGQQYNARQAYFTNLTPDHIILTQGRNLSKLGGFHYFYYLYFTDTVISNVEKWSILKSSE